MKNLLWILWVVLILIGIIAVFLAVVYIAGLYSTEYGEEKYEKTAPDYNETDRFYVTDDYDLLVSDSSLMPIAEKMNCYIERIIGVKLKVTGTKSERSYIELVVDKEIKDNYSFSSDNKNVTLKADNKDHLMRGVYAFLEEFGGIKCFTSKMIYASSDRLFFPVKDGGYSKSYSDFFEMRDTDWISPKDDEYSWFRGFNTDEYRYQVNTRKEEDESEEEKERRISAENAYYSSLGSRTQYISSFCHTFTGDFMNPEKYYDKGINLECYALDSKGNRRRDELCLSNPKTLEIVTKEVFEILENKKEGAFYDSEAPLQIISLTQSDDMTGCKCDACLKCAKEHGGYSAPNLLFVNKVAGAVKNAGYENVAIDTFAYRYTRSAPKDIVPLDNVIIRLCTIECCCSHYIDDEKCNTNKAFMKDLSDWSKICSRIYVWDYCTDFSYFTSLFPNFLTLAHNIRVFSELGIKGVYEEGNYTYDKDLGDPEFAELRAYLISRVMQNPYCDYKAVIREFCDAYYGEASDDMYNFIIKVSVMSGRRHLNIYMRPDMTLKCTKAEINELNGLFEHAKSVATGEALTHVQNSEICWRYYKMYKKALEFSKASDYDALREHLFVDLAAVNSGRIHEVDSMYKLSTLAQCSMIGFYTLFDAFAGKFVYGP